MQVITVKYPYATYMGEKLVSVPATGESSGDEDNYSISMLASFTNQDHLSLLLDNIAGFTKRMTPHTKFIITLYQPW